jgi:uncharacterized protein (TIGR02453 family)
MFEGFTPATIDFMWKLRLNNEKTWFEAHKDEFRRDFQLPMKELGLAVFERVKAAQSGRGFVQKLSRIYKDARRVRDGVPYRTNMWFSIERPSGEWTETPVFWFELMPENWSYGLGYYSAKPATMAKLRRRIDRDPKAFEKFIAPLAGQDEFVLEGQEYSRKKEAPTEKTAEWYNKKTLSLIHNQNNGNELYSPEFADRIAGGMLSLMPFYDYCVSLEADPAEADPAPGK